MPLNKDILKKRIRRFFESPPPERRAITQLIRKLEEVSEVYVFGGLLRDLGLYGGMGFNSDVDIVVVPHEAEALAAIVQEFEFSQNKFGGYRLTSNRWLFDIWEFDKTWAFSEKHIEPKSKHSLIETTFFNWDAVFYDIRANQIICEASYFEQLRNLSLDINFNLNPNVMGAFIRALRFIEKDNAKTEPKLTSFIVDCFKSETDAGILLYEAEHSNTPLLNADRLKSFRTKALCWEGERNFKWGARSQMDMFIE